MCYDLYINSGRWALGTGCFIKENIEVKRIGAFQRVIKHEASMNVSMSLAAENICLSFSLVIIYRAEHLTVEDKHCRKMVNRLFGLILFSSP